MIKGIDISRWQPAIDWPKVKKQGIEFAIVRCSNGLTKDSCFDMHMKNAADVGIHTGVYCFARANTVEKALIEAEFVLSLIKKHRLTYPVCYDMESTELMELDNKQRTEIAIAFCDRIEKAGYYAMIYTNKDWLENRLDYDRLKRFDIWLAQWRSSPTWKGSYGIWQFGLDSVDGIGDVDGNISYRNYPEIIKKAKLNHLDEIQLSPGDRVKYKGEVYASADGGEKIAVDGVFTVKEYNPQKKYGLLLEMPAYAKAQDIELI